MNRAPQSCNSLAAAALASVALFTTGCNRELVPVTGRVTFQDRPLTTGTVAFYPTAGGATGYGNIVDGRYAAKTGDRPGIRPGEYRVTVMAHENLPAQQQRMRPTGPPLLTPERYARPETSPLQYVVPTSGGTFDITVDAS